MKNFNLLSILLLCTLISFYSCDSGEEDPKTQKVENLVNPSQTTAPISTTPVSPNAATATTVAHYICPNNCAGSGGADKGTCPVCGTAYTHNQAYHDTPGATPDQNATPPPAEPAQNALGVWHFTCSNGCSGGAGSAGTCASCGGALSHNQAYHNF